MVKVAKVLIIINLNNKYSWAISNDNMDIIRDLKLICIKKY